MNSASGTNYG
jgi:hypothetical protein